MAKRSFKSVDAGDIASLLHIGDLHDTAVLPQEVRLNNWFASSSPDLTRSGLAASPDGFFVGWIFRGKSVKIIDWRKSRRNRIHQSGNDHLIDHNEAVQNYLDEVSIIECNKLIHCISFGKLEGRSKRQCARPLNENFHRALNFPLETGHIVATGYQEGHIDLWQVSTRSRIISLVDHKGSVRDVQFAPNGSLLLLSSSIDGCLKIWDCQDDGNLLKTLKPPHQTIGQAPVSAWSPDAGLIAGTGNSSLVAWEVADISLHHRKCPVVREFRGHLNNISSCVFSNDGSILLSGGKDCLLILWSTADASILRVFRSVYPCPSPYAAKEIGGPLEAFAILDIAFHPRGDNVTAVCADGSVRVWDISDESDDPLRACFLDKKPVGCVVVGGSGECEHDSRIFQNHSLSQSKIIVATFDGSMQVFDPPAQECPSSLQHLARNTLRKDRFHEKINDIRLPTKIKRFLKMAEFQPELRECSCESRHHQCKGAVNNSLSSAALVAAQSSGDETRARF